MTVETTTTIAGPYPTNGVATAFPFSFRALSADEVQVVREVGGVESTVSPSLYKVQLSAQSGTVVFDAPPAAGANIYVLSDPDFKQNISFSNQSAFLPSSHNEANDRSAIRAQVLAEQVKRAPVLPLDPSKAAGLFPKVLADGSWGYDPAGPGATGPANSTYTSRRKLEQAPVTNRSYNFAPDSDDTSGWPAGPYFFTPGDFSGAQYAADFISGQKVKLDAVPLTTGALVRQTADGVNFDGRSVFAKLRESVSASDARFAGGAKGDGVTDDYAALQAAIDSTKELRLPPGLYRTSKPLKLHDNLTIYGAGKSAWEPYGGGDFPDDIRSEIIVDGILALNGAGTNNVKVMGLSLKGKGGKQSAFGMPAGFQAGARGVDVAGSYQFEMRDVSFLGLERAFFADVAGSPAQMPSISDWMASDCATVFGFGDAGTNTYTARDVRIGECVIALHCNRFIDAHWVDGLRLENSRLFQAYERGIYLRHVPFATLVTSTIFEGAQNSVTAEDCQYLLSEMLIGRAGAYQASAAPYPTKQALVMTNCEDFKIGGEIVQPTGRAITLSGCANGEISAAIGTPYWTNGSATNDEGAVTILNSSSIAVHSSFGSNGHWVNVWADAKSAETLSGSIAAHRATGVVRAVNLQQKGGYTYRQAASAEIGPGGAAEFYTLRRFMPAGSVLVTRSVEITTPGLILRANGQDWQALVTDPGGGTVAFDNRILIDNSSGPDRWASVPLSFFSAAGAALPAGTEVRISTALLGGAS